MVLNRDFMQLLFILFPRFLKSQFKRESSQPHLLQTYVPATKKMKLSLRNDEELLYLGDHKITQWRGKYL